MIPYPAAGKEERKDMDDVYELHLLPAAGKEERKDMDDVDSLRSVHALAKGVSKARARIARH